MDPAGDAAHAIAQSTITPADRDKLSALEKQMRAELAKIMTPREYEDYELRGGNTANSLMPRCERTRRRCTAPYFAASRRSRRHARL